MPVSITTDHESVEVDLWGALFYTQRVTRSRQKEITRIEKAAEEIDMSAADAVDQMVRARAELLDQILKPAEGKRKQASAHIIAKWEADELTFAELDGFVDRLAEAVRPT